MLVITSAQMTCIRSCCGGIRGFRWPLVYRTLRLLTTMDLLRELELPEGGKRFELATENDDDHHHLICVACGRTEEFESPEVLQAGASAADQFGFKLLSPRLTVRGLCPSCAVLQGGEAN